MSIGKFFEGLETAIFSPIERAAEAVAHFEEEEVHMLTDEFSKLFDGIKAALGRASTNKSTADQKINDLTGQVSDLTAQVTSLKAQLADTQQQLSDAKDELTQVLDQVNSIAPDPAAQPAV